VVCKCAIICRALLQFSEASQFCLLLSHALCRKKILSTCLSSVPGSFAACLFRQSISSVSSSVRCCSVVLSQNCLTCCMEQCVRTGCLKLLLICWRYQSKCVTGEFEATGPPSHFSNHAQPVLSSAGCDL